jgi:hypothetical protein
MSVESDVGPETGGGRDDHPRRAPVGAWRDVLAIAGLVLLTLAVTVTFALQPHGAGDFRDRLILLIDGDAYGANLRQGRLLQSRAARARTVGADSLAEVLEWGAVRAFRRAAGAAAGPRDELAANDALAELYLALGWRYLASGRGGRFGIGRDAEKLEAAADIAACAAGLNPTRRRGELNAFLEGVEEVLERPASGRCPR